MIMREGWRERGGERGRHELQQDQDAGERWWMREGGIEGARGGGWLQ
jgi:hypothetical protein